MELISSYESSVGWYGLIKFDDGRCQEFSMGSDDAPHTLAAERGSVEMTEFDPETDQPVVRSEPTKNKWLALANNWHAAMQEVPRGDENSFSIR